MLQKFSKNETIPVLKPVLNIFIAIQVTVKYFLEMFIQCGFTPPIINVLLIFEEKSWQKYIKSLNFTDNQH